MTSPRARAGLVAILIPAVFVVAGYFYLRPASTYMLRGSSQWILGAGGDTLPVPTHDWILADTLKHHPSRMLYGTVYTEQLNAPHGFGLIIPWLERILAPLAALFLPYEAVSTAYVWAIMVLSACCFYVFGRMEGWQRPVALGLGIAFAFSVYTRARAFNHFGFSGVYILPLIFIALRKLQRNGSPQTLLSSAALLLLSAFSNHYYIVMVVGISPILLWFYLRDLPREPRRVGTRAFDRWTTKPLVRLGLAVLPALLFLVWNLKFTTPPGVDSAATVAPPPPLIEFLYRFDARPSDYLVGDLAMKRGKPKDWNPLRRAVTSYAYNNLARSNTHERSNGIRWCVLLVFLAVVVAFSLPRVRSNFDPGYRRPVSFFLVFSLVTFMFGLAPSAIHLEKDLGPALLLHKLVPNFRVPSRFGAFVHFGVLSVVGYTLTAWLRRLSAWRPQLGAAATIAVPVLVVLDYPPLQALPVEHPQPSLRALEEKGPQGQCGAGMFFPYFATNNGFEERDFYTGIQRLRGTHCRLMNGTIPTPTSSRLLRQLGTMALNAPDLESRLVRFARCTKMDWIVFRPSLRSDARKRICEELGWIQVGDEACRSMESTEDLVDPTKCIGQ